MASLLDFLSGTGLLGNYGSGSFYNEPDEAQASREAAAAAFRMRAGMNRPRPEEAPTGPMTAQAPFGYDPFNSPYQPANLFSPTQPQPQSTALPDWAGNFGLQAGGPPSMPAAPPQPMQGMPVSLNTGGGRMASTAVNPQTVAPGVSALSTSPTEPTPGDRGTAALMGFLGSGSILGGISNAIGGYTTGQRTDPAYLLKQQQENQVKTAHAVYQGLMSRGDYQPEEALALAQAVAGDKEVSKALLPQLFGPRKPSGEIELAGMKIPFYMGKDNKPTFIMPGGDLGGVQDLLDFANKQTQAKNAAEATGKATAEAKMELPAAQSNIETMMIEAQQLKTHKGLSRSVGPLAGHLPAGAAGTDQADFIARLDQLKGALSQAGIASMRGSGLRITQTEAQWFGAAMGRLNRTVGEENLKTALSDIEDKLRTIYKNNQIKADVTPQPLPTIAPKPGTYNWSPAGGLIQR